jgi:hypothetical protein
MREALHQDTGLKPSRGKRQTPVASLKNQSVIRAFTILKSFYSPDEWVAACDLARRAQIHEATVNRFMQSLVDVGAVVRDDAGKYRCVLFMMPGVHQGSLTGHKTERREPRLRAAS